MASNSSFPLRIATDILRRKLNNAQGRGSECIRDIEYSPLNGTLVIEFQKRGTYKYFNVPLDEFEGLNGASSMGTYFNLYIRDRFSYERIG